jgi:hypothetical protein
MIRFLAIATAAFLGTGVLVLSSVPQGFSLIA